MATNTTNTFTNHTGDGSEVNFPIVFSYILTTDIVVTVDNQLKNLGTDYTVTNNGQQITFATAPANTTNIKILRNTSISTKAVDFEDGSVLTESDLDTSTNQILFAQQELTNEYVKRDGSLTVTGNLVFEGATDNTNETTLAITDPTADRIITIPDVTGTIVTTGDTDTVSTSMLRNDIAISTSGNISTSANITSNGATFNTFSSGQLKFNIDSSNEISTGSGNLILDSAQGTVEVDDNLDVNNNLNVDGTLSSGNITITGTEARINFTDTSDNPDYTVLANFGLFAIGDATNNVTRFQINPDGHIDIAGNLDVGSLDVTANTTVGGTLGVTGTTTLQGQLNVEGASISVGAGLGDLILRKIGDDFFIDNGHNANSPQSDLYIRNNVGGVDHSGDIHIQAKAGEEGIVVADDASVILYCDNQIQLATSSLGVVSYVSFIPASDGDKDLGNAALLWKDIYVNNIKGDSIVTSGTSTSDSKVYSAKRTGELFRTEAQVNSQVVSLVDAVGGFVPIANETSFPNANPDINNGAGTLVSVPLANNITSNGSGVITIANGTVGNSTVTITDAGANKTFTANFAIIVETTTTLNTYKFHRYVPNADDVTTVAGKIDKVETVADNILDVNNFADRYRIATSDPSSNNDAGDLYFNSSSNQLKVYTGSAWQEATSLNVAGGAISGDITFVDNAKLKLGSSADLQIYHDSTHSYLTNDTGTLRVRGDDIRLQNKNGETFIKNTSDSSVELYFDNSKKLETTSSGAKVTGSLLIGTDTLGLSGADELTVNTPSGHGGITIRNADDSNGNIFFSDGTSGSAEYAGFIQYAHATDDLVFGANASTRMTIDSSGNVNIGTTSSFNSARLSVTGGLNGTHAVFSGQASRGLKISTENTVNNDDGVAYDAQTSTGKHLFKVAGSEKVRIDSSGNVGIGTTSPDNNVNYTTLTLNHSTAGGVLSFSQSDTRKALLYNDSSTGDLIIQGESSRSLRFATNGNNERMRIDTAGQVIIGGTSASSKFHVVGSGNDGIRVHVGTSSADQIYLGNTGGASSVGTLTNVGFNLIQNGGAALSIDTSRNINIPNDTGKLQLGTSQDLQIYHDGTHSHIDNSTGALVIDVEGNTQFETNSFFVLTNDNENAIRAFANGGVELYYNASKKLETTSTGATVTGRLGIGTSAKRQLHIHEPSTATVGLMLTNTATGTSNDSQGFQFKVGSDGTANIDQREDKDIILFTNATARLRITSDGNLNIPNDTGKLQLGASQDVQLFHDGGNTHFSNSTGTFKIKGDDIHLQNASGSEDYITTVANGAVELYFDNEKKLHTTAGGVVVTGDFATTGSGGTITANENLKIPNDTGKLLLGASNDLQIYHNGNHSYIADLGTGDLRITGSAIHLQNAVQGENMLKTFQDGAVELYYDNSKKFETTSYGNLSAGQVRVASSNATTVGFSLGDVGTGFYNSGSNSIGYSANGTQKWNINSLGDLRLVDNVKLNFGTGDDLQIYHDGTDSYLDNSTGELIPRSNRIRLRGKTGNETLAFFEENAASELYFDNSKKLNTISNGVAINTTATTSTSSSSTASLVLDGDGNAYQIAFNDVGLNADRGFIMKAVSGQTAVVGAVFVDEGNDGCGSISFGDAGTTFATSSDYRIKENITNITNAITRLKQLKPCRFNFKKDSTKTVDGFLAHEAQTVVPEAVTGTKDEVDSNNKPVYQGIDQSKLVPLLVAAVQELTAKVEALEAA